MRQITSQALRVVTLGQFADGIPPLAPRLAALNVAPLRSQSLEQLPEKLDSHDILLDDDQSSLSFYSKVLSQAGIQVLATQDPLLVLDALDEHKPDILVLDIEMPGCRGPELAKIESGSIDLSMEGVDLPALGEDCRHLIQPIADQAGIGLSLDLPAESSVFADRIRLKQVLLNLLSNAIKYNRPGGSIRLTAAADKPGHLRIAVTDTGPGIGLTITRRLVDMMGGEIGVASTLGAGSTFWLELALDQTAKVGAGMTATDR